jgi:ribonuclease P protein component
VPDNELIRETKKFTLPRELKIKKAEEFQKLYSEGRSIAGRYLILYFQKRGDGPTRAAFAAGKKLGKAHVRNRLKRLLRETFRLNRYRLRDGYDLILLARKAAVDVKMQDVEKVFLALANRAKILQNGDDA